MTNKDEGYMRQDIKRRQRKRKDRDCEAEAARLADGFEMIDEDDNGFEFGVVSSRDSEDE